MTVMVCVIGPGWNPNIKPTGRSTEREAVQLLHQTVAPAHQCVTVFSVVGGMPLAASSGVRVGSALLVNAAASRAQQANRGSSITTRCVAQVVRGAT